MRAKRGFTLIEIVVVIAVIGIMAAVLIPTFTHVVRNAKRTADIQQMQELNTMLIAEEISKNDLKNYSLQTEGWELAYSDSEGEVVIVDETDKIVAANDSKKVGEEIGDYVRVSELQDKVDSDSGEGGDGETEPGGKGTDPSESETNPGGGTELGGETSGSGDSSGGGTSGNEAGQGETTGGGTEAGDGKTDPSGSEKTDPSESETNPDGAIPQDWQGVNHWNDIEKEELTNQTAIIVDDEVTAEDLGTTFKDNNTLKRIYLGKGIKNIPNEAFNECKELTEVYIAGQLTAIGDKAFRYCKKLSKIHINSVESIGNFAFLNCESLKILELPESLKKINIKCFNGCNFEELTMPIAEKIEDSGSTGESTFKVAHLTLIGGTMNELSNSYIKGIISYNQDTLKKLTITELNAGSITSSPFSGMTANMTLEIPKELNEKCKELTPKAPFGSATVVVQE